MLNHFVVFILFVTAVSAAPLAVEKDGSRIVGGTNAPDGAYPYQISIRDEWGIHYCGGSIIKPTIILTAAHCATGVSSSKISVVVGTNLLESGGTKHSVRDIRSHDKYNPFTIENDIAILKLSSAVKYSNKVKSVDLQEEEVSVGATAILTGWGYSTYPGSNPNQLQQLDLDTISNDDCKKYHSKKKIFDTQICTLSPSGKGACQGDSGGPLVLKGKQIGIVSWGRPCAVGYPDVFTKVSAYQEWIRINSY